jgi:hypothetical protein
MVKARSLLMLLLVVAASAPPAHGGPSEYEVKAAFLYNFAKFVEWPASAFSAPGDALVVGVLGDDPFGDTLDRIAQNKSAQGRRIEVRRFRAVADVEGRCHILFVSPSEERDLPRIFRGLHGAPILTVSDIAGFLDHGGTINLLMEQRRVRFAVNLKAANQAGLKMSSQLLKIAKTVQN